MESIRRYLLETIGPSRLKAKFTYMMLLAGLIPLLLFAVPLYYYSTGTMERRARESLRNYSRLASGELFRILRSAERELNHLANTESIPPQGNTVLFQRLWRLDASHDRLRDGSVPWSGISEKTYDALVKGKTVLSPPYQRKDHVTISLLTLTADGKILVGELNPVELWQPTRTSYMATTDEIVIVNADGLILNSSNHDRFEPFTKVTRSMSPPSERVRFKLGRSTIEGMGTVLWGRKTLYLKARFESGQWYVFSLRPRRSVESLAITLVQTLAVFLVISILILVLIALRFARRMAAPVEELIEATRDIAGGKLDQEISVDTGDELEELANSFNRMSRSLQETTVSRNYLENVLASLNEGLAVLDSDGRIERVNRAFQEMVGRDESELEGTSFRQLLSETVEDAEDFSPDNLTEGSIEGREVELLTSSGESVSVLFSATPMSNTDEDPAGVVCGVTDITELKEIRENLEEATREKQTLLEEIHHRVKNNMQVISSLLELQSSESGDETVQKIFENSQQRIRSMALVHEKLYRAEGMASLEMEEYVRDLVEGLVRSQSTSETVPDVQYDIDGDIHLDLDRTIPCGLILNELVTNSLEHGFEEDVDDPRIVVEFRRENGKYRLSVSDNGKDLPEGLDPSESKTLGLQLVYDLAEVQLDGEVQVVSDNGTRFTVVFPVEAEAGEQSRG